MTTQNTNGNGGSSFLCLLKSKRSEEAATLFNMFVSWHNDPKTHYQHQMTQI